MPDTLTDLLHVPPFERETPRETRRRLNQMERWLARTSGQHDPAHVLYLHGLFEVAYKPEHADFLADYARALAVSLAPLQEGVDRAEPQKKDCLTNEARA